MNVSALHSEVRACEYPSHVPSPHALAARASHPAENKVQLPVSETGSAFETTEPTSPERLTATTVQSAGESLQRWVELRRPSDGRGQETDPWPQYAFKMSMFNVSCNSH